MDLAEIRKKARTQGAKPQPQEIEVVCPVDASPDLPAVQTSGDLHDNIALGDFATEEEYVQGLAALDDEADTERVQWLGFFLGAEEYALDIDVVSELIKPRTVTELPQVPDYVCGIISLRGEVIPVIDLKRRLGLSDDQLCDRELQRIIVCEGDNQRIGLLVDRISQVVRLAVDEIEKPQLVGDDLSVAFIKGIGRKNGRMLIQLRPDKAIEIVGIPGMDPDCRR